MPTEALNRLSRREREIMEVILELGECPARRVQQAMSEPPSYSAVRALLAKMERKGAITHRNEGGTYVYSVAAQPERVSRNAIQKILKIFFGGSAVSAITTMIDMKSAELDDDDLDELERQIERARTRRQGRR